MLPEVIFLSKTEDSLCRDSNLFIPDLEGLIVILVNGWI